MFSQHLATFFIATLRRTGSSLDCLKSRCESCGTLLFKRSQTEGKHNKHYHEKRLRSSSYALPWPVLPPDPNLDQPCLRPPNQKGP